jgi:hypothetical protein
MGTSTKLSRRLGVLTLLVGALFAFQGTSSAEAATGNVLASITLPASAGGVNVAFDGKYLYYTGVGGTVLHRVAPNGVPATDVPLLGGVAINGITYDATHDVFWGVDATGLNVYRIEKDGWVGLQFTLIPILDLPGSCNNFTGCSTTVSGLAYDATTDSLWYVPQGSQRVYHLNTAGQPLGYFDPVNLPECATNAITGIAAGANVLYLTAAGCSRGFQYSKSDTGTATKMSSFNVSSSQSAGASCDNTTFLNTTAMWVRDTANGSVRAIEVASASCVLGGGVALNKSAGWFSGAGEAGVFDPFTGAVLFPVQHAFHILCAVTNGGPPNNMVINWKDTTTGIRYSFHLDVVTTQDCFYDETIPASPPPCYPTPVAPTDKCFNSIVGEGLGTLIGRDGGNKVVVGGKSCPNGSRPPYCGQVEFKFTDRGEPNLGGPRPAGTQMFDEGEFTVSDVSDPNPLNAKAVVVACGCLRANYQAHNQQQ